LPSREIGWAFFLRVKQMVALRAFSAILLIMTAILGYQIIPDAELLGKLEDNFNYSELILFIFLLFSPVCICLLLPQSWILIAYPKFREFSPAITVFLLFILTIYGALLLPLANPDLRTSYAIIGSALVATLGWIVQQRSTRSQQRKQYTLQALEQFRTDREVQNHRLNIYTKYPGMTNIPNSFDELANLYMKFENKNNYGIDQNGNDKPLPTLYSIIEILNFYEQLSEGIRDHDIDEVIARIIHAGHEI